MKIGNTDIEKLYVGGTQASAAYLGEVKVFPTNVEYSIKYKSSNGDIVTPNTTAGFGANIVSNTYENGVGKIVFDAKPTTIPANAFQNKTNLNVVYLPTSITAIGYSAFLGIKDMNVFYDGTYSEWQNVTLGIQWVDKYAGVHYKANNKVDKNYVYYTPFNTGVTINFGIAVTTDIKIRFYVQSLGKTNGDIILGCQNNNDTDDFRFFQASSTDSYFDWENQRVFGNIGLKATSGNIWNVTLENFKMTNNETGQYKTYTARTSVPSANNMLSMRLAYWKTKYVEIYRGNTLVFSISACTCDGVAGFYDSVSDSFMTYPGLVSE